VVPREGGPEKAGKNLADDSEDEEEGDLETTGRPFVNPLLIRKHELDLADIAKRRFNFEKDKELAKIEKEK
jgi:hypothetical protein